MEIHHEINSVQMMLKHGCWTGMPKKLHWHENIEIVMAKNKPFVAFIDGVSYQVGIGDILFIDKHLIHSYDVPEDGTEIILGQLSYNVLLGFGVTPVPIKPHIRASEIIADEQLTAYLGTLMDIILQQGTILKGEENNFMRCIYSGLYYLLMDRFPATAQERVKSKENDDLHRIVAFANEHFDEKITIQSIAQSLYMDRGRVSELFAKFAGISLTDYINTLRITKAIGLMELGASKTSAAMDSGFQSLRTFNNVFRSVMSKKASKSSKM